jgi:hypothetical protein
MKKVKDTIRKEYQRSDFTKIERGKFYKEASKGTVVALISPEIAKSFPSSEAVNEALQGLLEIKKKTESIINPHSRSSKKRRTG